MAADYGRDILLSDSGDVIFTPDGDVELVSGGALVAQDVRTEAMLDKGSCFWAPSFGQGLGEALKRPGNIDVRARLRAAAMGDERIYFESINTEERSDGSYILSFQLLGEIEEMELLFDLGERLYDLG